MNIGIYGVSGSGKNHTISKLIERYSDLQYYKGSESLVKIAGLESREDLKNLSEFEIDVLRDQFIGFVKADSKGDVVVDGHYAFPIMNSYQVVMKESDKEFYDVIIYLRPDATQIVEWVSKDVSRNREELTVGELESWMDFEIKELLEVSKKYSTQLYVVNPTNIEKIFEYIDNQKYLNYETMLNNVFTELGNLSSEKEVVLVDGDMTLSYNDTTKDFVKTLDLDFMKIKNIFQKSEYSIQSFYEVGRLYTAIDNSEYKHAVKVAAREVRFNEELLNHLIGLQETHNIIILTSGISEIWQTIIEKNNLNFKLIGSNDYRKYLIDQVMKKLITKRLIESRDVLSFGDSMVDRDMLLESTKGVVVVNRRKNSLVIDYLKNEKNIFQLPIDDFVHPSIKRYEL